MTPMDGLASFGISIGAGIVIEARKLFISTEVRKQINKAFEESLKVYCVNEVTREIERQKIKNIFENASQQTNADLRNEEISGDYARFFSIFEAKLVKQESAYRYLKEVRDEKRYLEIISEFQTAIETLKEELKNASSSELEQEYRRQVKQYKSNLENFKPRTAFSNLTAVEKSFENYQFNPTDIMKSSLETLKGKCLEYMLDKKNEWQKAYIKAYKLNDKSRENLENACYAYFRLKEYGKAEELSDLLLSLDEFNSKAWVVKCLIKDEINLCDVLERVPKIVVEDLIFKSLIHARSIEKGSYLDLAEAFKTYNIIIDFTEFNGEPTTFENFHERSYLVNCASIKIMSLYITFNERSQLPKALSIPILELQDSYLKSVENSEITTDTSSLKLLNSYVHFLVNGKKDCVYNMKEYYMQSTQKQPHYSLILANSLQLIGDIEEAIEIIEEAEGHTSEMIALKLICYGKLDKIDNYISTAKEFLKGLTDITQYLVQLFIIPMVLNDKNRISDISIDEYINGKNFPNNESKDLLIEVLKVYKKENDPQTLNKLDKISESNNISETYMQSALAGAYLTLKEFPKAIKIYKDFLDFDNQSEDLLKYIQALYFSKSNNKELLKVLKLWRENFSFHPKVFELEVDLKRQLYKWSEIIEICDQYLKHVEFNEFIIANYALALNEIDKPQKEQFEKVISLIEKNSFSSYANTRAVAQLLIENGFHLEGLELLYKQAVDENNSQARMDYFMACVKCPKGILKEFEQVEVGYFIKFENNGTTSFVELTDGNPKTKVLLSKKVNEKVSFSGKFGNSTHDIIIKRIMNKYLSLHDQILQEVDNKNPFSEIPMQSYNAEKHIKEGRILDFLEEIIGKQDRKPDEFINEYYDGKISFTELVACEYSKNYIRAYYNLEYDKKGILQYAPNLYPDINLLNYDSFILDFSSLLRIFELYREKELRFDKKFILTSSTKSMIKAFSKDFVGYSGNQYVLDSVFYQDLLNWVDNNCTLKMPTSKLDIIQSIPKNFKGEKEQNLLIDTVLLSLENENSILITDDSIMLKFYPIRSGKIIGTSTFCLKSNIIGMTKKE